MRFLVDAQLPPALALFLKNAGHAAIHVFDVGLADATDEVIWRESQEKQYIIVTKDEDFAVKLLLDPKVCVVWIRIGNCSNRALIQKLSPLLDGILERLDQGERLIEVI